MRLIKTFLILFVSILLSNQLFAKDLTAVSYTHLTLPTKEGV